MEVMMNNFSISVLWVQLILLVSLLLVQTTHRHTQTRAVADDKPAPLICFCMAQGNIGVKRKSFTARLIESIDFANLKVDPPHCLYPQNGSNISHPNLLLTLHKVNIWLWAMLEMSAYNPLQSSTAKPLSCSFPYFAPTWKMVFFNWLNRVLCVAFASLRQSLSLFLSLFCCAPCLSWDLCSGKHNIVFMSYFRNIDALDDYWHWLFKSNLAHTHTYRYDITFCLPHRYCLEMFDISNRLRGFRHCVSSHRVEANIICYLNIVWTQPGIY